MIDKLRLVSQDIDGYYAILADQHLANLLCGQGGEPLRHEGADILRRY